jgi:hypothetical protein
MIVPTVANAETPARDVDDLPDCDICKAPPTGKYWLSEKGAETCLVNEAKAKRLEAAEDDAEDATAEANRQAGRADSAEADRAKERDKRVECEIEKRAAREDADKQRRRKWQFAGGGLLAGIIVGLLSAVALR